LHSYLFPHLTSGHQSCVEKHCLAPGGLCLVLVTPAYGSDRRQDLKYADLLKQVEEARSDGMFHYAWVNGSSAAGQQWAAALEVEASDMPRVMALAPKKLRAAHHLGSYSFNALKDFAGGVLSGVQKTFPLRAGAAFPSMPDDTKLCPPDVKPTPKPKAEQKSSSSGSGSGSSSSSGNYNVELTAKNFDEVVVASAQPWLVEYFAPWCGHCQKLAPEWKKAATSLKGIVRFGAVNCDDEANKPLCGKYGVQGFPTIKVFAASAPGEKKKKSAVSDYQQGRTAADLARFANSLVDSSLPSGLVQVPKGDEAMQQLLAQFGAGSADNAAAFQPMLLLFTDKSSTPALLKMAAHMLRPHAQVIEVRSHLKQAMEMFKVQKTPALMLLKGLTAEGGVSAEAYQGAVELDALVGWVASTLRVTLGGKSAAPPPPPPKAAEPPKTVTHVRTQAQLEQECTERAGLCVLAWLPAGEHTDVATAGTSAYVATLKALAAKFAARPFNFVYLDATAQAHFVEQLGGSPNDVGVVAFNARKARAANYFGVFAEEPLSEFLDGLMTGSVKTAPLPPKLAALAVAAADATEGKKAASCGSSTGGSDAAGAAADTGKCTAPPAKEEL
jgi:protein disulfide-isomerase A6